MKSNINTYMRILENIATDFVLRRYNEMHNESISDENIEDIIADMLIDYHDIITHVDINDTILHIDTIILAERFEIPCKIVYEHHYDVLEGKEKMNLYAYWKTEKTGHLYGTNKDGTRICIDCHYDY